MVSFGDISEHRSFGGGGAEDRWRVGGEEVQRGGRAGPERWVTREGGEVVQKELDEAGMP
jgi:hypothetical protein